MESVVPVRSERVQQQPLLQGAVVQRTRLKLWFITICASVLIWTCLVQLWHLRLLSDFNPLTNVSVRVDETMHSPLPSESFMCLNLDVVMLCDDFQEIYFLLCFVSIKSLFFLFCINKDT